MKELKDIAFDSNNIILKDNRVKGAILPKVADQLDRDIIIQGDTIIEGAVYANRLEIKGGGVEIQGSVFTQKETHINGDVEGDVIFRKALASVDSVVSHARKCRLMIASDINARQVRLTNTFVSGSIFADEVTLDHCVVCGGVFANKEAAIKNSVLGTFNAPYIVADGTIMLLLPSAFTLEPLQCNPATTRLVNLSLADLAALYTGHPQMPNTGAITMNLQADEVKSALTDDTRQLNLRSYTVVGKVLAADLLDWDKMRNHFLLTSAALNSQLLDTYDLGIAADGTKRTLTIQNLTDFFFQLIDGKHQIAELQSTFTIDQLKAQLA